MATVPANKPAKPAKPAKRAIYVELSEDGIVTLKRTGYHTPYDAFEDELYLPDFAGAITKEDHLNALVAREVYTAITDVICFVLGDRVQSPYYWQTFEVEVIDGNAEEKVATSDVSGNK